MGKAVYATNISPHRAVGTSPWIMRNLEDPPVFSPEIVKTKYYRNELEKKRDKIRLHYDKEIIKGKISCNVNLKKGDAVMIYRSFGSNKLRANWVEGYVVKDFVGVDAFLVSKGGRNYVVNKCMVKRDLTQ